MGIKENYQKVRNEIPDDVVIIAACKGRTKEEIKEVIEAGAKYLGENYVQEAERVYEELGEKAQKVKWHMFGHLQRNKINRALKIFDFIQTIDSKEIAVALNERAQNIGKIVPVLIEINLAGEKTKSGVKPEYSVVESLAREISELKNLRLEGLMAMEPQFTPTRKSLVWGCNNPEDSPSPCTQELGSRPFFKNAKVLFEKIKLLNLPNVEMETLSMGMSGSYKIAIEEGSNMVRLGAAIFGER